MCVKTLPVLANTSDAVSVAAIIDQYEQWVTDPRALEDFSGKLAQADGNYAFNWALMRKSAPHREAATRSVLENLAANDPYNGVEIVNSVAWSEPREASNLTRGHSEFDQYVGCFIFEVMSRHPQDRNLLVDMLSSAKAIQDTAIREGIVARAREAAERYFLEGAFQQIQADAEKP